MVRAFVTTVLDGGLGNRLFQMAAAFGYAADHNKICVVRSTLPNPHSPNSYTLDLFRYFPCLQANPTFVYRDDPGSRLTYVPIPHSDGDLELLGQFQSEKYLGAHRTQFLETLYFPDNDIGDALPYENTLFLHGRRGDYVNHPQYGLNLEGYYQRALAIAATRYGKNAVVAVFSDDLPWFRQWGLLKQFRSVFKDIVFVEEPRELHALTMMSRCSLGGICPNSTFSWWAAFRNPSPNKLIIFPGTWVNNPPARVEIQFSGSFVLPV